MAASSVPSITPIFALQNSEFCDFLYAPIGEEDNGMVVTALSALARIGVDPWQEAARLAQLPIAAASQRMRSIIAELPGGRWANADADTIAARLIALLPQPKAIRTLTQGAAFGNRPLSYRVAVFAFFLALNTAMFFVARSHEQPPVSGDGSGVASAPQWPSDVRPLDLK
jgi:hypothetical protein